jgi:hypothetical protein
MKTLNRLETFDFPIWMIVLVACLAAPLLSFVTQASTALLYMLVLLLVRQHGKIEIQNQRILYSAATSGAICVLALILVPTMRVVFCYWAGFCSGLFGY